MPRAAVRIVALSALTAYGSGLAPLAAGLRAGICPLRPAEGIGYPEDPPPRVSAFPAAAWPQGEDAAAAQLRETMDQLVAQWQGDPRQLQDQDTALIVGSGGFLYASGTELFWRSEHGGTRSQPFRVRPPAWGGEVIADHLRLEGPVLSLSTGCSSSANALLTAMEWLQRGRARRVIVVGAEGLSATTLSGFASLMLLDAQGCRPFDRDRAGLQIGEGIAALLLEADTGNGPGFTLLGGANLCDTHHLTSASPDGRVMRAVMEDALAAAGVAARELIAVKAHGTGSVDSDRAEAHALRALFGATLPPVIGLKRYLGHTLGACGAVETAALAAALHAGFLPASAGFAHTDPELGISPTRQSLPARRGAYLLNFFGFGGNYTSLVMAYG